MNSAVALKMLATHAALANRASDADGGNVHEGLVISGSWIASEGVCMVVIGDTIGFESPFFADGNTPIYVIARILNPQIGDQYAPVGGERVLLWQGYGGWVCKFYHGPDDTQQTLPSGERWISHRSASIPDDAPPDAPIPVVYDTSLKLTNDGPTTGDALGGARLGNGGALTQSSTASGARSTINDTEQSIEHVTAGGMVVGQYDQVKQIVTAVVLDQLQSVIDGIAEKIVHQASPEVLASIDAAGKEIALKVPSLVDEGRIGLGDFFENLPSASGAINEDILSSFGSNINTFGLNNLIQFANLLHTAGTVTSPQLVTILAALIPAWIAKIAVPAGSGVVRIAS